MDGVARATIGSSVPQPGGDRSSSILTYSDQCGRQAAAKVDGSDYSTETSNLVQSYASIKKQDH